ncbi:MAG: UbiA family prenyltransferase [Saprospiraceae bacterium]|nr:UbiA family prenyltransferase [Saprospiraceae bacterium]MCB9318769.1 UbiA family prenyltransferase [Lewinellaceae bacterium]
MLHHIRPLNIFLAIFAEWSIYYILIQPIPVARALVSSLQFLEFIGFSTGMMIAGYIINDLYDEAIDRANDRRSPLIRGVISRKALWIAFTAGQSLTLISWFLLWQSYHYHALIWLLWLGPVGLWFYATRLKCQPLSGNLLMAFFAACLPAMFLVREPGLPWSLEFPERIRFLFLWYLFFSFGATWYREIVKDLEDESGDRNGGCSTFPVRFGVASGRRYALIIGSLYLLGLVVFLGLLFFRVKFVTWAGIALIALPTLAIAMKCTIYKDFHQAQQWLKWHLTAGLFMLWIFKWMEVWNG